jgi:release factor glutamine methyltransferase
MCTGSGCIGLSLAKLGGYSVTLSDLSPRAIHVSRINRGGLDLEEQVEICHGDLFEALPEGKRFDVIVSNPPYIETAVIEDLQEEVRDHEPRMALDGMEDGLFFYRKLAKEAPQWLTPGGRIYLEIGYDQGESVPALLQAAGFVDVTVKKDLAGNDRVVRGVYPHV